MPPAYWLPPGLWMALILWLSGSTFSAEQTGALLAPVLHRLLPWASDLLVDLVHGGLRKLAHLTFYAVLAFLWYRAFTGGRGLPPRAAAPLAFVIAVAWAGVDEGHQAITPSRSGSLVDVGVDSAGAAVTLALAGGRRSRPTRTSAGARA